MLVDVNDNMSFDIRFYEILSFTTPKKMYKTPCTYSKNIIKYKFFTEICPVLTCHLGIKE